MLNRIIAETVAKQEKIEELQKQIAENKIQIDKMLRKNNKLFHVVEDEKLTKGAKLKAMIVERIYITYFADKLKEKLSKELCSKIIDKQYVIKEISDAVALLKKAGVKPDQFKKILFVNEQVNKEKIRNLFEVGTITKDDLKGCYSATLSKSIQINKK